MRKIFLIAALIMLSSPVMAAIDCSTTPSCDELGYVYSASDCNGLSPVKCPFDTSKLFCNKAVNGSSSDLSDYTMITQESANSAGGGDTYKLFRGNTKFALSENVSYSGRYISDYMSEIILDGQGYTFKPIENEGGSVGLEIGDESADVEFKNMTILLDSSCVITGGVTDAHSVIYIPSGKTLTLTNVTINNLLTNGVGIKNDGTLIMDSSVIINAKTQITGSGTVRR